MTLRICNERRRRTTGYPDPDTAEQAPSDTPTGPATPTISTQVQITEQTAERLRIATASLIADACHNMSRALSDEQLLVWPAAGRAPAASERRMITSRIGCVNPCVSGTS